MSATVGTRVVHRCYVSFAQAHYAGNLVDGAFSLARFGDAATDLCILTDGDEGLFAAYEEVRFLAPVYGGDVLEVVAELTRVGTRSRQVRFTATVRARACPAADRPGRSELLATPLLATTAVGTVVVPPRTD